VRPPGRPKGEDGRAQPEAASASPLTAAEVQALHEALDDEYRAWATYGQVLADFGDVPPFNHIRDAEARHIEALASLFARHGLALPPNPWPGRVARHASLQQACEAGVAAEIENAQMYGRLLPAVQQPDVQAVLRRLQAASQQRHLPAFQRCAQGGAAGACGAGARRRHRGGAGR
jgi:hypothetical protein